MELFILIAGFLLTLALGLFILWRLRGSGDSGGLSGGIDILSGQKVGEALQRQTADLAERIARSSGDLRQEISDRLSKGFLNLEKRVEEQLSQGRRESQEGLSRTTESLERKFKDLEEGSKRQLEAIRTKVDERLSEIGQKVQTKLDQNIQEGFKHFEKVQEHLKAAEAQLQSVGAVGTSINELNNLLKLPHLRGGFGEATLERLLSDFLPSHMYELQAGVEGGGRVDALVKFPRASLPIDSKFPREQILALFETGDPEALAEARKTFGKLLKREAARISEYIRTDTGSMDMALMFLPSETLYFEAIRDGALYENLSKKRVFPVSPNTLAITLRGIAVAHDYYEMARGVEKTIEEVQKAQRHFGHFEQKFGEVGKGLDKAQEAFSKAQRHLNRYSGAVVRLTGEQLEESAFSEESLLPFPEEPGKG